MLCSVFIPPSIHLLLLIWARSQQRRPDFLLQLSHSSVFWVFIGVSSHVCLHLESIKNRVLPSHLKLYGQHVKRGGAGQDGGVGLEKAGQGRPTVPEEQRVPGQEAGAEVWFTHQD